MSDPIAIEILRTWLDRLDAGTEAEAHGRPIAVDAEGRVAMTVHSFDRAIPPMDWDEVAALQTVMDLLPWFMRQVDNNDAEHPHVSCPECGSLVPLDESGSLRQHTNRVWVDGWKQVCEGGGWPASVNPAGGQGDE